MFTTRKKEHIRNKKTLKKGSNISSHAWLNDHSIGFDSARVIDKENFRVRKTFEFWHTAITNHASNNAKQLFNFILNLTLAFLLGHKHFYCFYYSFVFYTFYNIYFNVRASYLRNRKHVPCFYRVLVQIL